MAKLKKLVNGIAVFAIVLGSVFAFSAQSVKAAPAYDYQLISQSAYPATLAPGATTNVYIEVKNTGTATWGSNVRLGSGSAYGSASQQRDYSSEFANSDWPSANRAAGMSNGGAVTNILPGWVVRFQFNIKAPTANGTYKAYFTPVADGVTWMKDIGIFWQITVNDGTVPPVEPPVGGALSVALSSTSPAASSIPKDANGITFAKYTFTGGSTASTITSLTVKRVGAGEAADFDNVYLYDGDTRLTYGRSVNTSNNEVTFAGFSVAVPANSSKTLSVVADLSGTASNNDAFQIESASKITGATFSGNFPITGNYMTLTNATVGTATIVDSGSITDPKIGEVGVKVAEFKVTADIEDITLRRIALTNFGSISSANITGLSLKQAGVEIATSSFVGDLATFVLGTPMVINNGSNKIFQLYATVTGRVGDTIEIGVDDDADVYATGNTYGYGVGIDKTGYDGTATNESLSELIGGVITITSSGPATADISKDQQDKVFLNLAIASEVNAEVRNLDLEVIGTDLDRNYYSDIKIMDGSTIVAGPKNLADDTEDQVINFTDRFTLVAGQTRNLTVTMDISNNAGIVDGDDVSINLVAFAGDNDIKNTDTNTYVPDTDIVPSSDIVGKIMNIQSSSLVVSLASTPTDQSVVVNKTGVDTAGFLFTASAASAVIVTSVKFTGYADDSQDGTATAGTDGAIVMRNVISSISLYNSTTGAVISGPKSLSADGTVVFSGLAVNVPANGTVKLIPRVNIASTPDSYNFAFDINDVGGVLDVTAQDSNSNSIDVTLNVDPNNDTTPTTVVTVNAAGTLNAALSAATPVTTIAQAGSTNVESTKVRFSAVGEAFTVSELGILLTDGATDIDSVTLTSGSTTVTGSPSAGALRFTGLAINVPKDGNVEVSLKVNLNTISAGAISGDIFAVAIDKTDIKATGVDSGDIKLATDNAIALVGSDMYVKKTKPVITTSATSGTLAGTVNVYSMNIAAGSGDDAAFKQFTFDVSLSGLANQISNIEVYKDGVRIAPADLAIYTTDTDDTIDVGDTNMIISFIDGASKELVVAQGTSSTIIVKGTATTAANGTLTARLSDEAANTDATGALAAVAGGVQVGANGLMSIIWSDNSSTSHNASFAGSTDWNNGYPLKELPGATFSYTISGI